MKEYICTVCGYVHKGELPDGFRCPVCGAGKEAFREVTPQAQPEAAKPTPVPAPSVHEERELSAMEMSVICSNLARGCEKQFMPQQAEQFLALARFFRAAAGKADKKSAKAVAKLVEKDLSEGYPYANAVAQGAGDRGAMRSLVWSEKVTRMLQSLLARYAKVGNKMTENTGVYVCTICGFVYVGDAPPELCPVCKVPSWKFEKQQRRAK